MLTKHILYQLSYSGNFTKLLYPFLYEPPNHLEQEDQDPPKNKLSRKNRLIQNPFTSIQVSPTLVSDSYSHIDKHMWPHWI